MKIFTFITQKILYSPVVTNALLCLLAILYGAATFVEHAYSTQVAKNWFYNNPLVYLILLLAALNVTGILSKKSFFRKKKAGMIFFHASFLLILAGALITHMLGFEGIMHIREGESSGQIMIRHDADKNEVRNVPFTVALRKFTIHRYPGSQSPSSYESDLEIASKGKNRAELLYMNKVVHEQGYRLYQSSYDPDEKGTVLIVNYDPAGTAVTYAGYILMLIGILWILFSKGSRFGLLRAELKKTGVALLLLLPAFGMTHAGEISSEQKRQISRFAPGAHHADKFGSLMIQCHTGRTEPVNTYASKLLRKIYKERSYNGYSAEQVLLGMIIYPDFWNSLPLISQENPDLNKMLSTEGTHISYFSLFDNQGNYKLQKQVDEIYQKSPKERTKSDKDLLKLDEKVNIIFALQQGEFLSLFPNEREGGTKWYSPGEELTAFKGRDSVFVSKIFPWYLSELDNGIQNNDWSEADNLIGMMATYQKAKGKDAFPDERKIKAELLYNRLNIFGKSAIFYLALSVFLLAFAITDMFKRTGWSKNILRLLSGAILMVFAAHTFGIALRWYIGGQAPWSNAYESMVYVAWTAPLAGIFFMRRSSVTFGLSGLLAGFILLVSNFNFMDPEITPLVPVLKSPWLMFHVAVIMASYGFFGMSFFMSLFTTGASLGKKSPEFNRTLKELRIMNELSLIIGLALLSAGTFLGAVWANESWGRYWGWDPKEVWALVTMLVYAFVTHAHRIKSLRSDFAFDTMNLFAFASVLMTYFGVNYYLSGLHSYGKTDTPAILNVLYLIYMMVALLVAAVYMKRKKEYPKMEQKQEAPVTA